MRDQDYYTCSREPLPRATMGDGALLPFEKFSPPTSCERLEAPESLLDRSCPFFHLCEASLTLFRPFLQHALVPFFLSFGLRQPICAY